jgi:predicted ATPase/DNA-binding winged helix-turn-helix (wHTH) protein
MPLLEPAVPAPSTFPLGGVEVFAFGPFRFTAAKTLFHADKPVRLGSRALDILAALLRSAGDVVGKDVLIGAAWPDTFVDETNLRVHIAALRKALGESPDARYIATVPGRGYRFVAPVSRLSGNDHTAAAPSREARLPAPTVPLFGRDAAIAAIASDLSNHRLVTIVGPGGIGKTALAVVVAGQLAESFSGGRCFIDLAGLEAEGVGDALARAAAGGAGHGRQGRRLLVLDNCEHLVEALAPMVETLLAGDPDLHILATSREPLRVWAEQVRRLLTLPAPQAGEAVLAADALTYPAVQMFVARAAAWLHGFALTDHDAPLVGEICRRLDGLPLAIDLAVGQIEAFGLAGLSAVLADPLCLRIGGLRTAVSRHQSLGALIGWSYDLLSHAERLVLCRLGHLEGSFDLSTAVGAASRDGTPVSEAMAGIANLVTKSLITANISGTRALYRVHNTTRLYARERMMERHDADALASFAVPRGRGAAPPESARPL